MKVSFQLNDSLEQVVTLCRAVESLQDSLMCTDKQMFEIILVLEELIVNAMKHGGGSFVEVRLDKEWEELVITIIDDGKPFDPTTAPDVDIQQPLEKRNAGGLGIHLVHHYTDSFIYRRENDTNIVTFTKSI